MLGWGKELTTKGNRSHVYLLVEVPDGTTKVPLAEMLRARSGRALVFRWLVAEEKEERFKIAAAARTPLQRSVMYDLACYAGSSVGRALGTPY